MERSKGRSDPTNSKTRDQKHPYQRQIQAASTNRCRLGASKYIRPRIHLPPNMTKQNAPRTAQKDSRAWVNTLRGIGPLLYITQERTVGASLREMSSIVSIDTSRTVLAVGARASRGLGIFAGLMCLFPLWLIASSAYSGFASGERDEFFYNTVDANRKLTIF